MGYFAHLNIGKYRLKSQKYWIPYTWTILFANLKSKSVYTTNVRSALEKLHSRGLDLDDLESSLSKYSGWSKEYWNRYRSYTLSQDSDKLEERLKEDGFDEFDEEYPHVIHLLEDLELGEGLWELTLLYRMFLALNDSRPADEVILNIKEFRTDYDDFADLFKDVKQNFVDRVRMYDYLFSHTVGIEDKVSEVQQKITQFSEDNLIDRVVLPLLSKMGFHGIQKTPYHGRGERGMDIRPFYDIDKFGRRIYYGAQVKAIDIHVNTRKEGNAQQISNQLFDALESENLDTEDNENKRIDNILLITSRRVNDDARETFHKKFPNRLLFVIDGNLLSKRIVEYGLTDQILHTGKSRKRRLKIRE